MKYEDFLETLLIHKKMSEEFSELYDIGFNFFDAKYDLVNYLERFLDIVLRTHYTKEGVDWVTWFIYDAHYGQKDFSDMPLYQRDETNELKLIKKAGDVRWGAIDGNGEPICYSYETLYKHIEQHKHK